MSSLQTKFSLPNPDTYSERKLRALHDRCYEATPVSESYVRLNDKDTYTCCSSRNEFQWLIFLAEQQRLSTVWWVILSKLASV
jgi:hypothetical protein